MRYSSACSYPLGFAQASPRCRSVRLNGDPAVKRAGVPATITPHGLRHTCASLLVDQGADPVAVQEHLGHRDVATTLRIYRHLFADRSDQLTGALDAL